MVCLAMQQAVSSDIWRRSFDIAANWGSRARSGFDGVHAAERVAPDRRLAWTALAVVGFLCPVFVFLAGAGFCTRATAFCGVRLHEADVHKQASVHPLARIFRFVVCLAMQQAVSSDIWRRSFDIAANWGMFAVALALAVSMLQSVLPLTGVWRGLHSRLSVSCVRSFVFLAGAGFCTRATAFCGVRLHEADVHKQAFVHPLARIFRFVVCLVVQ